MLSRELIAASSKPLVLGILARGENYGYAIIREIREQSGEQIQWNEGMLYPVLHRLEEEELISARWGKSETGRERKLYTLTKKGRSALAKEQAQWLAVHETLERLWKPKLAST